MISFCERAREGTTYELPDFQSVEGWEIDKETYHKVQYAMF